MHAGRRGSTARISFVVSFLSIVLAVVGGTAGSAAAARRAGERAAKPRPTRCKPGKKVLRVGTYNGKKGQCASVQEAVDAIGPGGWVLVGPGDYKESQRRHDRRRPGR